MVPYKFIVIANGWRTALQVKDFRLKMGANILLLILCAIAAPLFFQFIQQRPGTLPKDIFLETLPTYDVSLTIFIILYTLIFWAILFLIQHPTLFLTTLQAYVLLTIFRFITLLLVPLEPPINMAELRDPFVQFLFYQDLITKDLFFSGHTSLLVLFTLVMPNGFTRMVFFVGSFAVATMLLFQHAHYTVDILFAPLFAWLALAISQYLSRFR